MKYSLDCHAQNTEADENSLCPSAWTLLCFTMSIMYFSSSTFHYTLHSALRFALGKEPFSRRCWWTLATKDLSSTIFLLVFVNSSSGVTIAKPVHKMCITVILHGKLACSQLLLTVHFSRHCCVCYLTYYWRNGYMSILACIPNTSATTKPITIVNWIHVCNISNSELHLELDCAVLTLSPGIFCILIHELTVF